MKSSKESNPQKKKEIFGQAIKSSDNSSNNKAESNGQYDAYNIEMSYDKSIDNSNK